MGERTYEGLFGIQITVRDKVVEIGFDDPNIKPRYAIQLESGAYWGQRLEENTRIYPTWKTKRGAERKFNALIKKGEIK